MSDGAAPTEPRGLKHPFVRAAVVLGAAYVLFKYGIAYLPPLFGVPSAPVPSSVVLQFMLTALVGVLLYVSADEMRWRQFKRPLISLAADPDKKLPRLVMLIGLPVLVGFLTYRQVSAGVGAPPALRSVHPAPPNQISFDGRTIRISGLENPLRSRGDMAEHIATGRTVYVRNCMACHGDRLDGGGHYAATFNPVPADFTSSGTIAQLTEAYVFWRIARGGPGLPNEGTPWNSAMPAWEGVLSEDEIWATILYLYDQTGYTPRTWEEHETEGAEH